MFITSIINRNSELGANVVLIPLSNEDRLFTVDTALNGVNICNGQVRPIQMRRVSTSLGTVDLYFAVTEVSRLGGRRQLGFVPLTGEEKARARLLLMNISN